MHAIRRLAHQLATAARRVWIPRVATAPRASELDALEFQLEIAPSTTLPVLLRNGSVRHSCPREAPGGVRLLLRSGESVETPPVRLGPEHVLRLRAATRSGGSVQIDGSTSTPREWRTLATWSPGPRRQLLELGLGDGDGSPLRLRVSCNQGQFELFELQVVAQHRCGRLHALGGYEYRLRNEVKHFSGALYADAMLGGSPKAASRGEGLLRTANAARPTHDPAAEPTQRAIAMLANLPANKGENAFAYAMRALSAMLPITPPDFFARARERSSKGPLSILSLCAGAARVEEQILAHCQGPVRLTLLDASEELIQRAADRLSRTGSGHTVDCLIGDVNRGLPGNDRYDVIVCVSALHHVADLETVLAQTNERLVDDGEFWSIGEQIGRNGNRLWPDALLAANRAFAQLPERLRRNAHSGLVDASVSDHDFSVASFEGIRSEELETMLEAHFVPVHVFKRNAFLWRLVDSTYGGNFDLAVDAHLAALRQLVVAEAVHWATGGRSTELHGVYRKKTLRAPATTS
jgi:SAM-dependent methyltransferase